MCNFFRKERDYIFESRFSKNLDNWKLNSTLIFKSKKETKKTSVIIDKKIIHIECTIFRNNIIVTRLDTQETITIQEQAVAGLLSTKDPQDLAYQAINSLCKAHAMSSSSSLLISGCITNNFQESKTYSGHKLRVKLSSRTPFANPHTSGLEKEYFLVGSVFDSDCAEIEYLGQTIGTIDEETSQDIKPLWKEKSKTADHY